MNELRIDSIERVVLNGMRTKLVTLYELIGNCWVYYGKFDVPARCGNKRLIEWICNNRL